MPVSLSQTPRTGGQIVVDALLQQGVDTAFTVPGESFLPILDALHDAREAIRLIVCRHEAPASHMSEAYGKLTVPGDAWPRCDAGQHWRAHRRARLHAHGLAGGAGELPVLGA